MIRAGRVPIAVAAALLLAAAGGARSAAAAKPPTVGPITATFAWPVTTYKVAVTGGAGKPHYAWKNTNPCGDFTGGDRAFATWSHPDSSKPGACPNQDVHPGTITVVVTDGGYSCKAVYPNGSAEGTAPKGGTCVAAGTTEQVTTTSGACPARGALPANCRYDLEVQVVGLPRSFSGDRLRDLQYKVNVFNNGPAASPALSGHHGLQAILTEHSTVGVVARTDIQAKIFRGRPHCRPLRTLGILYESCAVKPLPPNGEESFVVDGHWDVGQLRFYREAKADGGQISAKFEAFVPCADGDRNCKNNDDEDETRVR